ncbi:hypothetical protein GX50_08173 [[Emmonsia] crescens]|uniref:DUF7730 domain-containing protein n=1 Tax=[Emmonsia] crescens TaxID=73230 RepID=A0A2B7Z772_9EURO|nr:hypothetical protein GX50_08173 [Emmonsia crescens]
MSGYSACQTCYFRHTEAKHFNRQITEASVPALPKRRSRSLSLTPSGSQPLLPRNPLVPIHPMRYGQKPQAGKLDDQASTAFFKLSPELRQMIYREVLSGHDFAIMRIRSCPEAKRGNVKGKAKPGKLSHLKYSAESEQQQQSIQHPSWLRRYFGIVGIRPSPLNADFEPNVPGEELLPLVKSCRRIYLEAIDLLYSSNTFHFYHEDDFLAFSSAILPQRINEITLIHLHFFPDYYSILSCSQIPTIVSAMKNLRRLEISFRTILGKQHSTWFDDTNERILLRKLQDFGGNIPINLRLGLPSDRLLTLVESPDLPSNVRVVKLDLPLAVE